MVTHITSDPVKHLHLGDDRIEMVTLKSWPSLEKDVKDGGKLIVEELGKAANVFYKVYQFCTLCL